MNITEQKEKLFQQYPSEDLRLSDLQKCQKFRYERFANIVGKIASAVTLNDQRVFEDAARDYRTIYEELKEAGFCISESLRTKRQTEREKIKFRIGLITADLLQLDQTRQTLEKTLKNTIDTHAKRTEELRKWEDKLTKFEMEGK